MVRNLIKSKILLLLVISFFLTGCGDGLDILLSDERTPIQFNPVFKISDESNPEYLTDVRVEETDNGMIYTVPYGREITDLQPVISVDENILTPENTTINTDSIELIYILVDDSGNEHEFIITIIIDDSPPEVTLSVSDDSISEDSTGTEVTLTLSKTAAVDVDVDLLYSGTAIWEDDYSGTDSVAILAGEFSVPLVTPVTSTVIVSVSS